MEKKPPYFEHKKFAVVLITYAALAGLMADDLMLGIANSIRVDNIETAKIGASIELIIRLIYAIYDIQYWGLVIWQIITFIVAIWYGIDLYRMRRMNAKIECISNN
ncbi:hypothetical protein BLOT_001018 [Blomia tropicalis]|nr:hypothetical protein BLOT_001018 [Blomia tropicalis]